MKKILLGILFLALATTTMAQQNDDVPLPKGLQSYKARTDESARKIKLLTGGSFNFGVGGNALQFQISPHFGILPLDWLCIGVGGTYELYYAKDYSSGLKYTQHIFGARGFLEGYVWKHRIVLHGEYEWLSYPDANQDEMREQSHAILLGPGYQQEFSDRLSAYILCLFPVYEADGNPVNAYSVCDFRIGVHFKF